MAEGGSRQSDPRTNRVFKAMTRAADAVEQFRANYPVKSLVFDYAFHNKEPFDVSAIYHDDKFTYIKSSASEKFSVYELKDKKPDLITFQLEDGSKPHSVIIAEYQIYDYSKDRFLLLQTSRRGSK